MPIISTRNLRKQFGTGDVAVEVLRGVDLAIESGEFVALMGPSGSGKSTLLSILGGIEPPTSGEVILDGVDIANLSDDERTLLRRRKIGFVFQAFNLIPTLTALENVSLPLELDGVDAKEAKRRAMESLERVELGHRADHIPSKMSGGEQQRVAVARALAIQPAILLADEPTGNLDSRQSARVTALLRSLAADHKQTIIMVTHDANVAKSAFRLLMFRDGNIERDLSQAEFAASFPTIPSPPGQDLLRTPLSPRQVMRSSRREIANASWKTFQTRDPKPAVTKSADAAQRRYRRECNRCDFTRIELGTTRARSDGAIGYRKSLA